MTEIWGRGIKYKIGTLGGGRKEEFGPFDGRKFKFKYGHTYTKKTKSRHIMGKTFKISEDFWTTSWLYAVIYFCAIGARKFCIFVWMKNSRRALRKTILQTCGSNFVGFWPVWEGAKTPNLPPSLRPCVHVHMHALRIGRQFHHMTHRLVHRLWLQPSSTDTRAMSEGRCAWTWQWTAAVGNSRPMTSGRCWPCRWQFHSHQRIYCRHQSAGTR